MNRGMLTDEIKNKYGINTTTELRLLPYFQYLLINHMPVDSMKINKEEREILERWEDEGKITVSFWEPCTCTKEFWDWMNEILWLSYVPHFEEKILESNATTTEAPHCVKEDCYKCRFAQLRLSEYPCSKCTGFSNFTPKKEVSNKGKDMWEALRNGEPIPPIKEK